MSDGATPIATASPGEYEQLRASNIEARERFLRALNLADVQFEPSPKRLYNTKKRRAAAARAAAGEDESYDDEEDGDGDDDDDVDVDDVDDDDDLGVRKSRRLAGGASQLDEQMTDAEHLLQEKRAEENMRRLMEQYTNAPTGSRGDMVQSAKSTSTTVRKNKRTSTRVRTTANNSANNSTTNGNKNSRSSSTAAVTNADNDASTSPSSPDLEEIRELHAKLVASGVVATSDDRRLFLIPTGTEGFNDHTLHTKVPDLDACVWGFSVNMGKRIFLKVRPGDVFLFTSSASGKFNRVGLINETRVVDPHVTDKFWKRLDHASAKNKQKTSTAFCLIALMKVSRSPPIAKNLI
jgi:hypothetical protein